MKQSIQLQIPEPCHENWQQMTPVEQGRFCNACAKTVIDFSIMTDQQILDYLSATSAGICGRFQESQLHRTIQPMPVPPKSKWWMALLMPLLLGIQRLKAQQNESLQGKVAYPRPEVLVKKGEVAVPPQRALTAMHITGTVTDTAGKPIPYAIIHLESPSESVTADMEGKFSLRAETNQTSAVLTVSCLGYTSIRKEIPVQLQAVWNYVLVQEAAELKPVVVTASGIKGKLTTTRGAVAIVKNTVLGDILINCIKDTADYLGRKMMGKPDRFSVTPNPVRRSQQFILQSKEADNYTVQIVSNSGAVVYVQYFKSARDARQFITVQSSWMPGMYYVRIQDEKTKKQYSQKIIIL
ncbi:hypothetical protein HNQ91_000256 [Filimonas zeae]|nr:T9SS type A sorting domain-containing protein [Filimonas zeae]MDR6337234.1 hypothetical protein [Filimonas zeae]